MRALICISFVLATLATPSARAAPADTCAYTYADDFSTNAVESDSYSHSPITSEFCFSCVTGFLMLGPDSTGNQGLGFYPGDAYGVPGEYQAKLVYRFPLGGSVGVTAGSVEFDASPAPSLIGGGFFDYVWMAISYDGVTTASATRIVEPGHYRFDLAPSQAAAKTFIIFVGIFARLDNLSVCLDVPTPTSATSWGRLKSFYR